MAAVAVEAGLSPSTKPSRTLPPMSRPKAKAIHKGIAVNPSVRLCNVSDGSAT